MFPDILPLSSHAKRLSEFRMLGFTVGGTDTLVCVLGSSERGFSCSGFDKAKRPPRKATATLIVVNKPGNL